MTSNIENLEKLSHAVISLNNDAEGMHDLIQQSSSNLEKSMKVEARVAKELSESNEAVKTAVSQLVPKLEETDKLLEDVRKKTEETLSTAIYQIKDFRNESFQILEDISSDFKAYESKALLEARESRSDIQNDLLNHKNATSARIDSLENEISGLKTTIQSLEEQTCHSTRRAITPLIGLGIGIVILQIVLIAILLLI